MRNYYGEACVALLGPNESLALWFEKAECKLYVVLAISLIQVTFFHSQMNICMCINDKIENKWFSTERGLKLLFGNCFNVAYIYPTQCNSVAVRLVIVDQFCWSRVARWIAKYYPWYKQYSADSLCSYCYDRIWCGAY